MPKQTFFNLPEEKRNHILDVAVSEFADKGYKLASISAIVAAAGIAKGSFYQYFEGKDDLYVHIITQMIGDRKMAIIDGEKEQLVHLSLTGFLRVAFRRQLEEFKKQPRLLKIGLDLIHIMHEPIYQKVMSNYQGIATTYFLPYIQHEVAQGELDPKVNQQILNSMLMSLGQYLTTIYLSGSMDPEDISFEMIDRMVDDLDYIFTHGIYSK